MGRRRVRQGAAWSDTGVMCRVLHGGARAVGEKGLRCACIHALPSRIHELVVDLGEVSRVDRIDFEWPLNLPQVLLCQSVEDLSPTSPLLYLYTQQISPPSHRSESILSGDFFSVFLL